MLVKTDEIGKGVMFIPSGTVEYVLDSVASQAILEKVTGRVRVVSIDAGQTLTERTSPFDLFIHVIDGTAEVIIDSKSTELNAGQAIIIPAHARNSIVAKARFKMISTTIKSGYEEVS